MSEKEIPSFFHPWIRHWFESRIGRPTGVQMRAWPEIASGSHVLIVAPTGSGKTLAAFLWALDRLISGRLPTGRTGILYVSPLKALNNDIQRNLLRPLSELKDLFEKSGKLKAIVATSSLELGIDIGNLDEVILVQAPMSVSSAIQRIGRSGHHVGGMSRGTFFPTHSMDLLEAAVLSEAVRSGDIEPVRPVEAPLDVLAQITFP